MIKFSLTNNISCTFLREAVYACYQCLNLNLIIRKQSCEPRLKGVLPDNCLRLFKHVNVMKYQVRKNKKGREIRKFLNETKETRQQWLLMTLDWILDQIYETIIKDFSTVEYELYMRYFQMIQEKNIKKNEKAKMKKILRKTPAGRKSRSLLLKYICYTCVIEIS